MPGILILWIWIVKRFRQISGFKCNNDVKTLWGGWIRLARSILCHRGCPVQALLGRVCLAVGLCFSNAETAPLSAPSGLRAIASNLPGPHSNSYQEATHPTRWAM